MDQHFIRLRIAYRHFIIWQKRFGTITPGTRILEVGCGSGYLLRFLSKEFPDIDIIGLDKEIKLTRFNTKKTIKVKLIKGDAENLPIKSGTIASVFALHIIEHVRNPERLIAEAQRVLQPNGLLFLATPNPSGIGARIMGSRWCGWRDDHVSIRKPFEWMKALSTLGFLPVLIGTTGLSGIPIFKYPPFSFFNHLPLSIWGILPWFHGEALIGIFRSEKQAR